MIKQFYVRIARRHRQREKTVCEREAKIADRMLSLMIPGKACEVPRQIGKKPMENSNARFSRVISFRIFREGCYDH